MALFNVPFKRESVDIFQVEARSRIEAAMLAERRRNAGEKPDFTHEVKFSLGTVQTALAEQVAAGLADRDDDPVV